MIVAKGSGIDSNIRQVYVERYMADRWHSLRTIEYANALAQTGMVSNKKIREWMGIEDTNRYYFDNRCPYCNVQYEGREVQCTKCGGPR